jgi:hypothetical protein
MSLNDEERRTLVRLQMEKANRFLEQAEMVRGLQQWDLMLNPKNDDAYGLRKI